MTYHPPEHYPWKEAYKKMIKAGKKLNQKAIKKVKEK